MAENSTVDIPQSKPKFENESKLAEFADSSDEQVCANCGNPQI